ncbi:methionine aminotransferase [Pedobacter cryotolerans]|uniref:Aminotransferase class I/II-fold pyridoxal phosphate-dependent enzyme n=1 Tax=Pedobacter cryotolerans TaxID=2571270 RepID=A0A4U1C9K0_9SPHI|nr:methionine aminotransferase [Pedobacter cryotolerans]TKC02445.1 aminotransferase class I/II-fold pyridoxal phosphate-dependent enzyme [Pedobacter cryotolerans]
MIHINSKLPTVGTTIFSVMSKLAQEHNAINLSQGFPDYPTDPKLIALINDAMLAGHNQYAPMVGSAILKEIVAKKMIAHYGAKYNEETEITITAGGTQAIFTAIASVINPGDEVIIFEPAYDCYAPTVKLFGGLVKPFTLHAPDYTIDWEMVKKLFSANTRMIILNSPQNPTGSILSKTDIEALIKLTKDTDVLILSDEVYEHVIFDDAQHESIARYPELRDRSFIIASFGKLLHTTGWKLGYCLAPIKLTSEFRKVHQFNVFSVNTPMQIGIANYLANDQIYRDISLFFQQKRDLFRTLLSETKFKLLPCKGSYFQCVSFAHLTDESDIEFAKRIITEFGVASIPVSAFYTNKTDDKILRFCFAKEQKTLEAAVEKLKKI